MCGIAGLLSDAPEPVKCRWVERMCARLVHRGPDDSGIFVDPNVALGHRRLSIIDLEGGAQPLANEDGTIQVVFNGEIYNFQELRAELTDRGHHFRTRSDTEVLVHLYEEEAEQMVRRLNGMFAFAIWDQRSRTLLLARDRLGKKPLYWTTAIPGIEFCFASELKALASLHGFPGHINWQGLGNFLSLGYIPDPETIYVDVWRLKPGHWMKVQNGRIVERRYWSVEFAPFPEGDFQQALEAIRELAADAVRRRLVSDVPLGAFLSGGIDSSAVVATMRRLASEVKTFSIGFTSKRYDELEYARAVAEFCRTEHREQVVSPAVEDILEQLADSYDEPFGDSSAIPTLYLCRMTRQFVKVALSGDGADEAFAGYRRYAYAALEERLRHWLPTLLRETAIRALAKAYPKFDFLPQIFRAKTLLTNLAQDLANAYFTTMSIFRDEGLQRIAGEALRTALRTASPRNQFVDRFHKYRHLPPLSQIQAVDLETYLPGDILVKVDRASMAFSLECRCPWLDYRLVELAAQLPPEFKLRGMTGKYVFKKAMEPLLPEAIPWRKKMGFAVPLEEWFRGHFDELFHAFVLRPEMEEYIDLAEAKRLYQEHRSRLHNHDRRLWNLFMLGCWDARHRRRWQLDQGALREQLRNRTRTPSPTSYGT